jgi:hypothetical protein
MSFVSNSACGLRGVLYGMKGLFEGLLQNNGESYKLLSSMAVMIETSAENHMTLRVLQNGILPVNRIENR